MQASAEQRAGAPNMAEARFDGASRVSTEAICGLVDAVGRSDFVTRMLASAKLVARADYVSIFVFPTQDRPVFIGTDSLNSPLLANRAAEHYTSRHYRDDPNVEILFNTPREPGTMTTYMRRGDIASASYRIMCYDRAQILDRLSLLTATGRGQPLTISFYRATSTGEFSQEDRAALVDFMPYARAATLRHIELPNASERDVEALLIRVKERFPHLSRREAQVTAGVLAGMTAAEMGQWLGIAPTSVITHRKRAYEHLGVANQRELIALCYST
ncbi:transcriptional regulator, LuxR family [Rhizobiales bacterium GAS191]|nr:transcriptional regulator, LuxR family [Rhizobiales bacterium GAS191]